MPFGNMQTRRLGTWRQSIKLMPRDLGRQADDAARAGNDAAAKQALEFQLQPRKRELRSSQLCLFKCVVHCEVRAKKETGEEKKGVSRRVAQNDPMSPPRQASEAEVEAHAKQGVTQPSRPTCQGRT